MIFFTGSIALRHYNRLKDRTPEDIDYIYHPNEDFMIIKSKANSLGLDPESCEYEKSSKLIYEYCLQRINSLDKIKVRNPAFGSHVAIFQKVPEFLEGYVAPLEIIKLMKLSCVDILNKPKHKLDLQQLEDVTLTEELESILKIRIKETKKRKNSDTFLNKYRVVRYLDHDKIHSYISKDSMYQKIKDKKGMASHKLFESLDNMQKKQLIWEEVMALALERSLIYSIRQNRMLMKIYLKSFMEKDTSSSPMIFWLHQLSQRNQIRDNPEFIANWIESNYLFILDGMSDFWEKTFNSLPVEFWEEVLTNPRIS